MESEKCPLLSILVTMIRFQVLLFSGFDFIDFYFLKQQTLKYLLKIIKKTSVNFDPVILINKQPWEWKIKE